MQENDRLQMIMQPITASHYDVEKGKKIKALNKD